MAIATSVAIGAGLTAASIAIGAATTGASFAQAAKAKKDQRAAELKAEEAMSEARKKLDVNYYESLSVKKEPYELEREALLASGAQAIEAGVESERGAGAVAGRVQMAQNEQQGAIRTSMGKELTDLEKLTAGEESRLRDVNVQLDLEEIAGAQQAAAASQEQYAKSITAGVQGLSSLAQDALQQVPLYLKQGQKTVTPNAPMDNSGTAIAITPTKSNLDWANPGLGSSYAYPTPSTPAAAIPAYAEPATDPLTGKAIFPYPYEQYPGFKMVEGRQDGGVMVVGGEGNDDIALVEAVTGNDTGKRVSKGEMIVVSKKNVGTIKKAIKAKDKDTVFKVVEAQLKAKPIKKKSVKK